MPARHAESSPLSADAQAAAPLAVNATLEAEPHLEGAQADAGAPADGQAPADPAHHHHQHGGQTHAH